MREALESETLTPRQREAVDLIEAEYGKEAIAKFREEGVLPRRRESGSGVENSHPNGIQTEPERGTHPVIWCLADSTAAQSMEAIRGHRCTETRWLLTTPRRVDSSFWMRTARLSVRVGLARSMKVR